MPGLIYTLLNAAPANTHEVHQLATPSLDRWNRNSHFRTSLDRWNDQEGWWWWFNLTKWHFKISMANKKDLTKNTKKSLILKDGAAWRNAKALVPDCTPLPRSSTTAVTQTSCASTWAGGWWSFKSNILTTCSWIPCSIWYWVCLNLSSTPGERCLPRHSTWRGGDWLLRPALVQRCQGEEKPDSEQVSLCCHLI